jgi:hypothetical protein
MEMERLVPIMNERATGRGNHGMKWSCTICGGTGLKIIIVNADANGGQYDVYCCDHCMVGKTTPVIPAADLAKLYSTDR